MSEDSCELICIDAPRDEAIRAKLLGEGAALEAADPEVVEVHEGDALRGGTLNGRWLFRKGSA